MSRKGAKSRTRRRKLRSSGTKARTRVVSARQSQSSLVTKLKARARDLEKKLSEALEQQTASSNVLQVISSSPGELEPVFQAMLQNATRICEAKFGTMYLREGDAFRTVALHNAPPAFAEARKRGPIRPGPKAALTRMLRTKQVVHVPDVALDEGYIARDPLFVSGVEVGGFRSFLVVPMLKETEVIGSITIYRQEVQPFSDKQIALVRSFASQAIIAIENTRLLHELRQRTDDLGEALEQQTATSEVLKVISSSPGELNLVFNIMLAKATELCEASYGTLWLRDGDGYRAAAIHGDLPTLFVEQWRGTLYRPDPEVTLARSVRARKPIQEADVRTTPQYLIGDPLPVTAVDIAGIRTLMVVPMLKDNEPIGGIAIYRKEVRPFGEKQIELVTNFAAQAVIAIENARLLNELRESLQQQTATADVLSVISSSAGELEPVFSTMLENATRICEAKFGVLLLCDSGGFRTVALHNAPPAFAEERRRNPLIHPAPGTGLRRLADTKQVAQVADMKALKPYIDGDPFVVNSVDLGGYRTVINVPMLKENSLVGAISIYRQEVRPFTDKQIELVQNFANQAVIAIENARLLNELRESLQQQTATADVLKVISSSPGNLGAVFQAMLENAVHICEAKFGVTNLHENGVLRMGAMHNVPSAFAEFLQERVTYEPLPGSLLARVVQTKQVCHVVPPNLSAEQQPSAARALPSAYQW